MNEVTMSGAMLYCGWPYYAWSAGYDTNYRAAQAVTIYTTSDSETLKKTVQQEKTSPAMKTSPVQNMGKYVPYWQNVLDKIRQGGKMTIYANLIGTKGVLVNDLIVGIEFPGKVTEFAKKVLEEHENKTLIEKIVSMEQGKPMQIKILDKNADSQPTKKQGIEGFAEEQDITFNVIDE